MKKTMPILAVIATTTIALGVILVITCISYSNQEVRLRNQITAKQRDNTSELDNVQKKISQFVQVTDLQMAAIKDIIVGNATARKGGSGNLATFVTEAVPNIDTSTFNNLQNVIAGSRDAWTMRQKELLDLKREHDNLIDVFPSSLIVGSRGKIEVVIVTSAAVKENFLTGEDNNTKLK
jgi:hypothetical protein